MSTGGYKYMDDLLRMDHCRPEVPTRLPTAMEQILTPLNWREWDRCLMAHPDQRFRTYIVEGIRYGFRIGFNYSSSCVSTPRNMASAMKNPEVIREYLANECSEGRVLGPLDPGSLPQVNTSRFGVIPKGSSGGWRLILDLSFPEGSSVNDGIDPSMCSLSYVSVDDAAREVFRQGQHSLMAKVDVKSAYRNIPVHPDDRWLLGMQWGGAVYVDTALPFGLRSAPKIFTAVADAVEWILRSEGVNFVIHYLDDFLLVGPPNSDECASSLAILLRVFKRLGLPVAVHKLEGPWWCLSFLGFEVDSNAMEVRLPRSKLLELKELLATWQSRRTCRKKELESLVGKLAHACKVVRPGKTFLRRMFEVVSGVHQPHHHVRLNAEFRSDLTWWATFLESWNGVSLLQEFGPRQISHQFVSDASGSFGCGALWEFRWLQLQWPQSCREDFVQLTEASITLKELLPVVIACAVWGREWQNSSVLVHCDNVGAVSLINSGYSRVPAIMHLLRCLFFIRAFFKLTLWAVHIPGRENALADAISRNNLDFLFSQIPRAAMSHYHIPADLLALLIEQQPDWTSPAWARLFRNCFWQA